jgi:hypothetical protein
VRAPQRFRALLAAAASLLIGACAMNGITGLKGRPGADSRPAPSQNADLPYQFTIDGFEIEVASAALTTDAVAFEQRVNDRIADDERWLGVGVTVVEKQGRERHFPWITMVRLRTALGLIVNAPHALTAGAERLSSEQEMLAPNERQELRLFFRVKRGDFPIQLVFADGAAAPLGE